MGGCGSKAREQADAAQMVIHDTAQATTDAAAATATAAVELELDDLTEASTKVAGATAAVVSTAADALYSTLLGMLRKSDGLKTALIGLEKDTVTRLGSALEQKSVATTWLTSNGLTSETLRCAFVKTMLKRKGVFDKGDEEATLPALVEKYKATLGSLKVLHLNDSLFHRNSDVIRQWRVDHAIYFWDVELAETMGFDRANITTIQVLEKPWLFDRPGDDGMYAPQSPGVPHEAEEEAEYYEKLARTQEAYDGLKRDPPAMPLLSANGLNCADELAAVSVRLDTKYHEALKAWADKTFADVDIVCGQGGEVVLLNMTYQLNRAFCKELVGAVHANKVLYISVSAGTMVTAKSMEMTGEIKPGWIEAFACDEKYIAMEGLYSQKRLNMEGIDSHVYGALPLFASPIALRPHYTPAWEAEVARKNGLAVAEFEEAMKRKLYGAKHVDADMVEKSKDGCDGAMRLLNVISLNAKDQDRPVFIPIHDGRAIQCKFLPGLLPGVERPTEVWNVVV